ncbi:hypothetical protein PNOK_0828200 [Pyrrhoderma noxium]|uniref:Uncharacterized protein n=1 Tax=Pyrrhoderma noxium TaxID=2282107 RepID=A0A286UAQ6_9AGAM|nr:hypothetical protein PNOK_0828200 [Pyrrhoderma noxium]
MSSIPKSLNPHKLLADCEPSSRAKIFDFSTSDGEYTDSEPEQVSTSALPSENISSSAKLGKRKRRKHPEQLNWLEEHLRSSLLFKTPGTKNVNVVASSSFENGGSEERTRKNKGKETSGCGDVDEGGIGEAGSTGSSVYEFRLLSSSSRATLQRINILPKPPKPTRAVEREYEDNPESASIRLSRAHQVAVDFSWVIAQSKICYPAWPKARTEENVYTIDTSSLSGSSESSLSSASILPTLLITESRPRPRHKNPTTSTTNLKNITLPSPHELKGKEGKLAGGVREKGRSAEKKEITNQDQIAVHSQPCRGHDRFNEAMSYSRLETSFSSCKLFI